MRYSLFRRHSHTAPPHRRMWRRLQPAAVPLGPHKTTPPHSSFLVIGLLLATSLSLAAPSPDAVPLGVDLLKNGSIEADSPAAPQPDKKVYWNPEKKGGGYFPNWPLAFTFHDREGSGPVELDDAVSLHGRRSVRLTCALFGNNGFYFVQALDIPAREGDVFHAGVFLRSESDATMFRSLTIQYRTASGKTETVAATFPKLPPGDSPWRRLDLTSVAPPGTLALAAVSFKISNTPMFGRMWWDAFTLTKLSAAPPPAGD